MKRTRGSLGETMDILGVRHEIEDGHTVCGAVVLLKIVDGDGCITLGAEWSTGLTWLERVGMLREAEHAESRWHRDP